MNSTGSHVFGTSVMKTDECVLMAKVMQENGSPKEQIMTELYAIDDMLSMQRISSVINSSRYTAKGRIRKNSSLSDMINGRIDTLLHELKTS